MTALVRTNALCKSFAGVHAVDRVSFAVARGEVVGVLGPNGAGKTTTLRMLAGYLRPDSGTASICGHDVQTDGLAARRRLGFLPEGAPLYPEMTVTGLLGFVAAARGLGGRRRRAAIARALELAELATVRRQEIGTLSKGFRRRLGLAQALLHDPPVLVLDEPTDGLDPNQKHAARALIARLAPERAIVVSTHLLDEVEAVCTRAVVIARGQVVADETPQALRARDPEGRLDAAFRALTAPAPA